LQKIVRFLKENPGLKVEVSGHTDNSGAETYNLQLSERRAQAVYNYLVANGIASERLRLRGYGAGKPIADNNTEEGKQKNRRIEFKLIR